LVQVGVDATLLRPTGYPYFDQFVRRAREERRARLRKRPRAVIVSNGMGILGQAGAPVVQDALTFYELALGVAEKLQRTHDVVFRLKAGETPRTFLPSHMFARMESLDMAVDDGLSRSIDLLPDFDLVVGGESTVLLEALILGVAPALLDTPSVIREQELRSSIYKALTELLGVEVIRTPHEIADALAATSDTSYVPRLQSRLMDEQELLFHALDGRSGARVARVILEAAGSAKAEAG